MSKEIAMKMDEVLLCLNECMPVAANNNNVPGADKAE